MTTTETPRVWVGSLAAYNGGELFGEWFDAVDAPTDGLDFVQRMASVKYPEHPPLDEASAEYLAREHEELWVMDHEGFSGLLKGECSPMAAQELAELIEAVESDGHDVAAVSAWVENIGVDLEGKDWVDVSEDFMGAYEGEHGSELDYVHDLIDGGALGDDLPEFAKQYFDYAGFARDVFMSDNYSVPAPGGNVYVFRNV